MSSPVSVEFPGEVLLELGWGESRGVLFGWRKGREVRISTLGTRVDEEQEKVGVFVSRVRGEVFLTEGDLRFMTEHGVDLALVAAGQRAGFFVREISGSIQTVRSHEEFSTEQKEEVTSTAVPKTAVAKTSAKPVRSRERRRKWIPAGLFAVVGLLAAAVVVLPQRAAQARWKAAGRSMEVREEARQLFISWQPMQNAVLTIEDNGSIVSIPVYADQSTVTYLPRGNDIEVRLTGLRTLSAHYTREIGRQ